MKRIDIAKLRKSAGISQRQLAEMLQVRPSFLSAIENGRSRLPEEKMLKIKELLDIDSFEAYLIDEPAESVVIVPPHTHNEPVDSLAHLINQFHDLAHRSQDLSHHNHGGNTTDADPDGRIEYLTKRNDRLNDRVDELRQQVDSLREKLYEIREENLRLKELLIRNGIAY